MLCDGRDARGGGGGELGVMPVKEKVVCRDEGAWLKRSAVGWRQLDDEHRRHRVVRHVREAQVAAQDVMRIVEVDLTLIGSVRQVV